MECSVDVSLIMFVDVLQFFFILANFLIQMFFFLPSNYFVCFALKSVLSDNHITTHACFFKKLMLTRCIFLHPFIFNLLILCLKRVSYRKHIVGCMILYSLSNLCLLVGVFRPFTSEVIIDLLGLKSPILLLVFFSFSLFLVTFWGGGPCELLEHVLRFYFVLFT